MPFSLRIDDDAGIAIGTCSGVLGPDEARSGAAAVWSDPESCGKPVVWDFRAARLDFSTPDLQEMARFILTHQPAPPPRVAFVTNRTVDFGLGRMFEVFREHPSTEVRVFRDYAAAVAWASAPPRAVRTA